MRAYIEFYPVFFILFAILINELNLWVKLPIVLISLVTIPISLIQTYQYKNCILSWDSMTKKSYWEIFLKQEDKYKGYLWKRNYNFKNYSIEKQLCLGKKIAYPNTETILLKINSNDINRFNKVNLIQVKFDNYFSAEDDSKLLFTIKDSVNNTESYSFNPPLVHFAEQGFNKYHTGEYNMEVPINANRNQLIKLSIYSPNRKDTLSNLKVTFFIPR